MRGNRIDLAAAAIFVAVGLVFALGAWHGLTMGRALRMGPGYFPVVLGLILVGLGVAVGIKALRAAPQARGPVAWRGLILVTIAIVFFGTTVRGLGLVPGVAGAVVLASLATPGTSLPLILGLSAGLTAFCVAVFTYGIGLPLALIGPWLAG